MIFMPTSLARSESFSAENSTLSIVTTPVNSDSSGAEISLVAWLLIIGVVLAHADPPIDNVRHAAAAVAAIALIKLFILNTIHLESMA